MHFALKNNKINNKNPIKIIQNNSSHWWPATILQQQLLSLMIHAIFPGRPTNFLTFLWLPQFPDFLWLSRSVGTLWRINHLSAQFTAQSAQQAVAYQHSTTAHTQLTSSELRQRVRSINHIHMHDVTVVITHNRVAILYQTDSLVCRVAKFFSYTISQWHWPPPRAWNSLPSDIRTSAPSFDTFKKHLKSYLFQLSFSSL